MTDEELRDALDGLFAADSGQTNGIRDEALRRQCIAEMYARMGLPVIPMTAEKVTLEFRDTVVAINQLGEIAPRLFLSRMVRDMWLSEEALGQGYGIEDVVVFLRWLHERMGIDLNAHFAFA